MDLIFLLNTYNNQFKYLDRFVQLAANGRGYLKQLLYFLRINL